MKGNIIMTIKQPMWNHRELIGYARNEKQAERIIRSKMQNIIKGWKVAIRLRDTEIIDLPAGFVFSVHP